MVWGLSFSWKQKWTVDTIHRSWFHSFIQLRSKKKDLTDVYHERHWKWYWYHDIIVWNVWWIAVYCSVSDIKDTAQWYVGSRTLLACGRSCQETRKIRPLSEIYWSLSPQNRSTVSTQRTFSTGFIHLKFLVLN